MFIFSMSIYFIERHSLTSLAFDYNRQIAKANSEKINAVILENIQVLN